MDVHISVARLIFLATFSFLLTNKIFGQSCNGQDCENVEMPLLDDANVPLLAHLDFSKLNSKLKIFIENEIEKGVHAAMKTLMSNITQEAIQDALVDTKKDTAEEMKILDDKINNATIEMKGLHQNVGFHAKVTSNVNLDNSQTIIFDHVYTNTGNSNNSQTGHFTANRDGMFYFESSFFSTGSLNIQMVNNNQEITRAQEQTGTMNALVLLQKGDIVKCRHIPRYSTQTIYGDWSFFTGFLLS